MRDAEAAAARVAETFSLLKPLDGVWCGQGSGKYPTIDAFEYQETLRFEIAPSYPMFHYEQRAFLLPSMEPSHWESGFVRPLEDGSVDISSSQDSGRVEVLRSRVVQGNGTDDLVLELRNVVLDHDPHLVGTRRVFTLRGDTLRYVVSMSTTTTETPHMQQHLEAVLHRSPP